MIKSLIENYKNGDNEIMLDIINQFSPLIEKYNKKYENEDISSELIITLIKLINSLDIKKFKFDGEIINYIKIAIKNRYLDIIRQNSKKNEFLFYELDTDISDYNNLYEKLISDIEYERILNTLNSKERLIIDGLYNLQKKEVEIAQELGLSKQNIHNIKKKTLKKISKFVEKEGFYYGVRSY